MEMISAIVGFTMMAVVWMAASYFARFVDRSIDEDLPDPAWLDTGSR